MKVIAPIYENADTPQKMYLRGVVVELSAREFADLQGIRTNDYTPHSLRPYAGQGFNIKSAAMVRDQLEKVRDETRTSVIRATDCVKRLQELADDLKGITDAANDKPPQPTETE